jgi:hypothetical protein
LIDRDFVFHTEIAPAKPMIAEDLTEPVMAGGVIRVLEHRTNDLLRTIWRIHSIFCCTARTKPLYLKEIIRNRVLFSPISIIENYRSCLS